MIYDIKTVLQNKFEYKIDYLDEGIVQRASWDAMVTYFADFITVHAYPPHKVKTQPVHLRSHVYAEYFLLPLNLIILEEISRRSMLFHY